MEAQILQYAPHYKRVLRSVAGITDPLWRAEGLRGFLREDRYLHLLKETFQPRPNAAPNRTLDQLVQLPFRHILTQLPGFVIVLTWQSGPGTGHSI
jgi:hypothetical protein